MVPACEGIAMLECAAGSLQGEGCVGEVQPWLVCQVRSQALSLLIKARRSPRRENDEMARTPALVWSDSRRLLQNNMSIGPPDTERADAGAQRMACVPW